MYRIYNIKLEKLLRVIVNVTHVMLNLQLVKKQNYKYYLNNV